MIYTWHAANAYVDLRFQAMSYNASVVLEHKSCQVCVPLVPSMYQGQVASWRCSSPDPVPATAQLAVHNNRQGAGVWLRAMWACRASYASDASLNLASATCLLSPSCKSGCLHTKQRTPCQASLYHPVRLHGMQVVTLTLRRHTHHARAHA